MHVGFTTWPGWSRHCHFSIARLLIRLLTLLLLPSALSLNIQVCQNKDCCRRFQGASNLPRILKDLDLQVTTTGCLSLCDKGPNVVVVNDNGDQQIWNGIVTPVTALAALEPVCGPVSPKLKAAMQVMEAGQRALSLDDKETQFGSVIRVLGEDEELCRSTAFAHAIVLRAVGRCDARQYELALQDTQTALQVLRKHDDAEQDVDLLSKAYRIQADSYEGLGQLAEAIESLRQWGLCDPSFSTKIRKEMERLRQKM